MWDRDLGFRIFFVFFLFFGYILYIGRVAIGVCRVQDFESSGFGRGVHRV